MTNPGLGRDGGRNDPGGDRGRMRAPRGRSVSPQHRPSPPSLIFFSNHGGGSLSATEWPSASGSGLQRASTAGARQRPAAAATGRAPFRRRAAARAHGRLSERRRRHRMAAPTEFPLAPHTAAQVSSKLSATVSAEAQSRRTQASRCNLNVHGAYLGTSPFACLTLCLPQGAPAY